MAYEIQVLDISLEAAEDLSDDQYKFVVMDGTSGKARRPDSATEYSLGVLQNAPESGEAASIRVLGISKLCANAALSIGTFVMPEYVGAADAGKAASAAANYEYARAYLLETSGAEDDLVAALLIGPNPFVATDINLAEGKILIGDANGAAAAQTPSGDVTVSTAGVMTIGAKKVLAAMTAIADGKIFIGGEGGAAAEQTLSGDVTMTNAGVTTIGSGKVLLAMLAAALQPSHVVKFAGTSSAEEDADGSLVITVTGALETDIASVVLRAAANDVYVKKAVLTENTLTVTLSGAGGVGTQVDYVVYRAAS